MAGRAATREGERQGDFVGGKYLLEECLGIGGMGEVYRATNVSLGRKVAIKLLNKEHTANEDDVLRFLREARAAAAVRHPNVVDVFDVARDDDGTPFIVQELLSGEDLEQYLGASRGGKIGALEALEIMIPVTEAVAAAHARDVVHRDLKPANIFLAREGNKIIPKVLDFGACLYQTVGALSAKEQRMLIGTPHYMAPEQITTAQDVDPRADVWAMGVILYEMLVGLTPFEAEDANAVLKLVRTRAVPLLRKVAPAAPEALEDLVQRCLERDRKKRFPNAAAVRAGLDAIRNELTKGSSQKRIETVAMIAPELGPARNEPPSSHRIPSLVLKGAKPKKRRGSSLLNLSAPEEEVAWGADPPASMSRPIDGATPTARPPARPARTAADVIRDAEEASGVVRRSAPSLPPFVPNAINSLSLPVPATVPPASSPTSRPGREPGAPRDLDFDETDHLALDLDLAPQSSRHGRTPGNSSIPPVLDPRSAGLMRADWSDRPPSSLDGLSERPGRVSGVKTREVALTPPLGPPSSARSPRSSLSAETARAVERPWTASANALFGLAVLAPAVVTVVALRQAPFITAPLGHAMRGDSPLASGVLAVVALIGAAVLASKSLGSSRSNALVVATVGAVLCGIVMIIVTFAASETADLEISPAVAALVPFIAPIVPLGIGLAAAFRARAVWRSRYERREAVTFVLLASLMLFAVFELGPFGAVRGLTPSAASTPAGRATSSTRERSE